MADLMNIGGRLGRGSDEEFEGGPGDAFIKARGVHGLHTVKFVESDELAYRFPYPYLMPIVETPGKLVCTFGEYEVTILGENLGDLEEKLGEYRVKEVRQGGPGVLGVTVRSVKVKEL